MAKGENEKAAASTTTDDAGEDAKRVANAKGGKLAGLTEATPMDDSIRASGGWEGPAWLPQLSELAPKRQAQLLEKQPNAVIEPLSIKGKLKTPIAWGRPVYALETVAGLIKLPEHAMLYSSLNTIKLDAEVYIKYEGPSEKNSPGKQPATMYDVRCGKKDICIGKRADALTIQKTQGDGKSTPTDEDVPF